MTLRNFFVKNQVKVLAISLLTSFGVSAQEAGRPQTWAVVVGVDDYKSVTKLEFAGNDARLFADTLKEVNHVPDDHIFVFTSDAKKDDLKPSVPNILFRLEKLEQFVKPEDTVIFYFAGHGMCLEGETFLLTEEADNRSKRNLILTALPGNVIFNDYLAKLKAKNSLVVLDACRNDPEKGRATGDNPLTPEMSRSLRFSSSGNNPGAQGGVDNGKVRATLMACSDGERSYEWRDKKHGYFTYYLVEGLKSGARTQDKVTLTSLAGYLEKEVAAATKREQSHVQTPKINIEGTQAALNDWVLASFAPAMTAVVNLVPPPPKVDPQLELAKQQLEEKEAKLQLAERAKVAAEQRAKAEEAKRLEAEAKSKALEMQLAIENNKNKAETSGSAATSKKLQEDLLRAQEELELAKGAAKAAELRVSASEVSKEEAIARANAAEKTQAALKAQLQAPGNSEANRLAGEAKQLQEQLRQAQDAKDSAELRARQAEAQLAATQGDVEQRRLLRTSGKNPNRRTDPSTLFQVEESKGF